MAIDCHRQEEAPNLTSSNTRGFEYPKDCITNPKSVTEKTAVPMATLPITWISGENYPWPQ
jgi:hypothetical protein